MGKQAGMAAQDMSPAQMPHTCLRVPSVSLSYSPTNTGLEQDTGVLAGS